MPFFSIQGTWKEQLKQKFRNGRRGAKRSHVEASDENEPPTNSSVAEKANKKRRYTGGMSTLSLHVAYRIDRETFPRDLAMSL